ncbi:MAG TPA: NAD(P)H-hydrate dehydratase [Actinomycetota bacterium]|nr:NAD(P)H-hydrate dehydratase [Actinomycetota bacterium]
MRPLVTPEEMAVADQAAIEAGTPVEVLMERAGRAVARAAIDVAGGRYGRHAVLVCGKGNNGGDGFVAARVLRSEGLGVRCLFVGDLDAVEGAPRHHLELLRQHSVTVGSFDARTLAGADVVIDALFGTGFRGATEGEAATAIDAMNASRAPIVAVDIPSGVNGTTGATEGRAVEAIVTVAMGAEKVGTAVGRGAALAGAVTVADIGIPVSPSGLSIAQEEDVRCVLPTRAVDAHKRSNGSVALLGGSDGMSGAAILTARGAVRMGAGYATAGVTRTVDPIVSEALPEVLTKIVTDSEVLGTDVLEHFKDVLERAGALALGPGLGQGDAQRGLVDRALREVELPLVVDADGLNVLAGHTYALADRVTDTVITPHPAELARLLEMETSAIEGDRVAAAREAAKRFGCVVVLKGFRSIIAQPDGTAVVNPTGGPSLATAGTGDVLTGAIAALLAAGLDAFEAAWAATYVHGLAGDLAGVEGVVAWDVAEALPDAIALVRGG